MTRATQSYSPKSYRSHRLWSRLGVDLHPGEGAICLLLFFLHFLLLACQYASKTLRQASFIDEIGATRLPLVYLAVPLVAFPLLALHGRWVARWSTGRLMATSCLLAGGSFIVFWWWMGKPSPTSSLAFYLWTSVVGLILVSQMWTLASCRLDPRQAKRLFSFIGAGGILGSIAGGQMAHLASRFAEPRTVLLAASGALVLAALALALPIARASPAEKRDEAKTAATPDRIHGKQGGFSLLRRSPYLRLVAALVLLSSMVAQVVDLQFNWAIEASTNSLQERASLIGNFYSLMGLAALIFQMLLTSRIHRRLGIGFALRLPPVVNGVGTLLFLAAALFQPLLLPAVAMLKIGENGLRYSLDQVNRELLFLPLPRRDRAVAKAFIDVFVQRSAKGLAALGLLTVTFGWLSVPTTVLFSLAFLLLWLVLIAPIRRHYIHAYRQGILARDEKPDLHLDLSDAATLEMLFEGLGATDSKRVIQSLDLLVSGHKAHLVPPQLLHHDDPRVRRRALRALRLANRRDAIASIEALLGDPEAEVRASATRALAQLAPGGMEELMRRHLRDPDLQVRTEALTYLAKDEEGNGKRLAEEVLKEMLADGEPETRQHAARVLGGLEDPRLQAALMRLLYDSDPDVTRQAILAVRQRVLAGSSNPIYVPTLVSHLHERRLKRAARQALVAYGPGVIPALGHFLADPDEEIWVRRALPKTIAEIGGAEAMDTLLGQLDTPDIFSRRKMVEALTRLRRHSPKLCPRAETLESAIADECRSFLRIRLDLGTLEDGRTLEGVEPRVRQDTTSSRRRLPHLLERLLADRLEEHLDILSGLLALQHPRGEVRAAFRGLQDSQPLARAHALEFLDSVLVGDTRRQVLAVLDDLGQHERRQRADRLFGLTPESRDAVLRRLIDQRSEQDVEAAWLSAAAMHYIHDLGLTDIQGQIRSAALADSDPLVRETAHFLYKKLPEKD